MNLDCIWDNNNIFKNHISYHQIRFLIIISEINVE